MISAVHWFALFTIAVFLFYFVDWSVDKCAEWRAQYDAAFEISDIDLSDVEL